MKKRKKPPESIFERIAIAHGVSVGEVARKMQAAVDVAWSNPDPVIHAKQQPPEFLPCFSKYPLQFPKWYGKI